MRIGSARLRIVLAGLLAFVVLDAARSLGTRLVVGVAPPRSDVPAAPEEEPEAAPDPRAERGRYLVESGLCGHCHTPFQRDGASLPGLQLAGGVRFVAWPFGVYVSGNLTPDPSTGIGAWSDAEIVRALREGHSPQRALDTVVMPSVLYASYGADDAEAIARYLRSLPPVTNAAPAPLHYGVIETLVGKLLFFGGALPASQRIAPGNFGRAGPASSLVESLLSLLPGLQLGILVGLLIVGVRTGGWGLPRLWWIAAALVGVVAWGVVRFPALPFVSAVSVRDALFPEPSLAVSDDSPEALARLERGRQIYLTAGCAVCHGLDGAERIRLRWDAFGSVATANLTPHASGLGGVSDADFEAALRGGRSRDGRAMHARAMPWPRFARLGPEDSRDLLAFLRALPPVACAPREAAPPSAGDPSELTVSFRAASDCRLPPPGGE